MNARASSKEKSVNLGVDGLSELEFLSDSVNLSSADPESESEEENKLESSESLFLWSEKYKTFSPKLFVKRSESHYYLFLLYIGILSLKNETFILIILQ